ncbi:unnamed protein product [Linum trigynum]|uniref:Uncharacterized protein n=1 Tax=Linum trigynum TaxID=586398 RepID=A0AAV2GV84_9ROSI
MMMDAAAAAAALKGGGGGRVAFAAVVDDDMGDGMQCSDHPNRSNPGGICAFCLQEKLGKLVNSSFPLSVRASTSSSSSPSFRSDGPSAAASAAATSLALAVRPSGSSSSTAYGSARGVRRNDSMSNGNGTHTNGQYNSSDYYSASLRKARIPFLLAKKKKKIMAAATSSSSSENQHDVVFKRSKSTAAPGRRPAHFFDDGEDFTPRKRGGFWSFLYHSTSNNPKSNLDPSSVASHKRVENQNKISSVPAAASGTAASSTVSSAAYPPALRKDRCLGVGGSSLSRRTEMVVVEEDEESPNSQATSSNSAASSFERKVSRSRSVGCGSRSFSGDFFERISTGFGDCTLRRVESQREGKPKSGGAIKERVKCGGIFRGFIITSSSSSSTSSSYWVSSLAEEMNGKSGGNHLSNGRARSWTWAFASPMRAFGGSNKPSGKDNGKRDHHQVIRETGNRNSAAAPNLAAIPSLLTVERQRKRERERDKALLVRLVRIL